AVVDKMLVKDATQRYQTPIEIVEALAPWAQGANGIEIPRAPLPEPKTESEVIRALIDPDAPLKPLSSKTRRSKQIESESSASSPSEPAESRRSADASGPPSPPARRTAAAKKTDQMAARHEEAPVKGRGSGKGKGKNGSVSPVATQAKAEEQDDLSLEELST